MPDRYFTDIDALISAANDAVKKILLDDIAPIAEEILREHIKSDIYGTYTPKPGAWVSGTTYQRRHVLETSIKSSMMSKNTMLVTGYATASKSVVNGWSFANKHPGAFLQMLESGNTGIWRGGFARPAVSNAQKEIDKSTQITSAIRNGIKREIG